MIKPPKLNKGDTVATISLSWGAAGDIPHRYEIGKKRLQEVFGLNVIETTHCQKSAKWLFENPEARAQDLMEAFANKSVKAIISNIGGEDSIRTLPYIDFDVIKNNPKIFLGFSDTTVSHLCCYKAGLTSFYGTSLFVGFAENVAMYPYEVESIKNNFFSNEAVGEMKPAKGWTSERLSWEDDRFSNVPRPYNPQVPWRFLQGSGIVEGELLGGCAAVLEWLKDTPVWVKPDEWKGKIMFYETSEEMPHPDYVKRCLRNYAASGILHNINGLIVGRPYENKYWKEYDEVILQVINKEQGLTDLPIVTGMDFGHSSPSFILPYGVNAQINSDAKTFSILESGVV